MSSIKERGQAVWARIKRITSMVRGRSGRNGSRTEASSPMLLVVGSLQNCTRKDALFYAQGVAEQCVVAKDNAWLRVKPYGHGYLYEIQEGGVGASVLERLIDALPKDEDGALVDATLNLKLNDDVLMELGYARGQFYSLVLPSPEEMDASSRIMRERNILSFSQLAGKSTMTRLVKRKGGVDVVAIMVCLIFVGAASFVSGAQGWMRMTALYEMTLGDYDTLSTFTPARLSNRHHIKRFRDNPTIKLSEAREEAIKEGRRLVEFKKEEGKWSWTLESAASRSQTSAQSRAPSRTKNGSEDRAQSRAQAHATVQAADGAQNAALPEDDPRDDGLQMEGAR